MILIDDVDELVQVGGPYIPFLMTELIQTSKLLVIGISTTAFGYVRIKTLPDFKDRTILETWLNKPKDSHLLT
jgi:hypothetical protein